MSYSFDGIDDLITHPSATYTNALVSMYCRCYPTSLGESNRAQLITHGIGVNQSARFVIRFDTVVAVNTFLFGSGRSTTDGYWNAPANSVVLNQWQSFGARYDSTLTANNATLFKNGLPITATRSAPSGTSNPEPLAVYIGNDSTAARTFAGVIAAVAMWNRLLADSEFALVEYCGIGKVLRGLSLWYDMRTQMVDQTGSGRVATVTGALWVPGAEGHR